MDIAIDWDGTKFTLTKDVGAMVGGPNRGKNLIFSWEITNTSGKTIDVTVGPTGDLPPHTIDLDSWKNIAHNASKILSIGVARNGDGNSTGVWQYRFTVTDHADATIQTVFTADDPWIIVF